MTGAELLAGIDADATEGSRVLQHLLECLAEAESGRGRTVLVTGLIGTGKSVPLQQLLQAAERTDAVILSVAAAEGERDLPLGVVGHLLEQVPEPRSAGLRAALEDVWTMQDHADSGSTAGADGSEQDVTLPSRRVDQLSRTLLAAVAGRRPGVVVIDDAHHVDPQSALVLMALARSARASSLLLVLGHTDQPPLGDSNVRLALSRHPDVLELVLANLGPEEVRELTHNALGREFGESVLEHVLALSGGNPLLVQACLCDFVTALSEAAPDPAGEIAREVPATLETYQRAVLSILRSSGRLVGRTVQALAVLDDPAQLPDLLADDPAELQRHLACMEHTGLLTNGRFRHPAARTAILAALDARARVALHERVGELAYRAGRPPTEVADHLVAAGAVRAPWARAVLESASADAAAGADGDGDGDIEQAIRYLELAHDGCTDEVESARLGVKLTRLEWRLDPNRPAHRLRSLIAAMRAGLLSCDDVLVLISCFAYHGMEDEAREALARVSEGVNDLGAHALRPARDWLHDSYAPLADELALMTGGAAPSGRTDSVRLVAHPGIAAGLRSEALALLRRVLVGRVDASAIEEAERILASARADTFELDTSSSALFALYYLGRTEKAVRWCTLLLEDCRPEHGATRGALLRLILALLSLRQGALPDVERLTREALDQLSPRSWGVQLALLTGTLAHALTDMGRTDDALAVLSRPIPSAAMNTRFGLHYLHARGRTRLATGHAAAALQDFRLCGSLMGAWGIDAAGVIPWRVEAARAHLALDQAEEATRIIDEHLAADGKLLARSFGDAMRVLAATHEPRERPRRLRHAVDILQRSGDKYLVASALTDLTLAHQELGELGRARIIGLRARAMADDCRAEPLRRRLAEGLGEIELIPMSTPCTTLRASGEAAERDRPGSGAVPGLTSVATPAMGDAAATTDAVEDAAQLLSDAERRVASMAAMGYTNREISKRLYVTVSTVEQHLTKAYRKLRVARRTDLPSALLTTQVGA